MHIFHRQFDFLFYVYLILLPITFRFESSFLCATHFFSSLLAVVVVVAAVPFFSRLTFTPLVKQLVVCFYAIFPWYSPKCLRLLAFNSDRCVPFFCPLFHLYLQTFHCCQYNFGPMRIKKTVFTETSYCNFFFPFASVCFSFGWLRCFRFSCHFSSVR